MNDKAAEYLDLLIKRYPELEVCREDILNAYVIMVDTYKHGGKLLIAGNGGSAADAEHMVGELMKGFKLSRCLSVDLRDRICSVNPKAGNYISDNLQGALPAIALDGHVALTTAYMNDCSADLCFAQQVLGYGNVNDVYLGISTSGNSKNVIYASNVAKAKGLKTIGLTGSSGGKLIDFVDICIKVPSDETYMIQEFHLPIYHCLCLMLEADFFE